MAYQSVLNWITPVGEQQGLGLSGLKKALDLQGGGVVENPGEEEAVGSDGGDLGPTFRHCPGENRISNGRGLCGAP